MLGNNPTTAGRGRIGNGGSDGDITTGSTAGERPGVVTAVAGEEPTKEFGVEGTPRIDPGRTDVLDDSVIEGSE